MILREMSFYPTVYQSKINDSKFAHDRSYAIKIAVASTRANSSGKIDEKFLRPEIDFARIWQEDSHLVSSLKHIDRREPFC